MGVGGSLFGAVRKLMGVDLGGGGRLTGVDGKLWELLGADGKLVGS